MNSEIKKKLEEANKCIFVKKYDTSRDALNQILLSPEGSREILVHLRRIELATRLGDAKALLAQYKEASPKSQGEESINALCIALTEALAHMVDPRASVDRFTEIMETYSESPAAYFGLAFCFDLLGNVERSLLNYKQCLKLDSNWYPAYFGLSQVSYKSRQDRDGDYYFYMFERFAPYNLYGNFATHKRLTEEFAERGLFEDAETAITTLSDWWVENKGTCPVELKVYEILTLADIARKMRDKDRESLCLERAHQQTFEVLKGEEIGEDALYFIAKSFEEFGDFDTAFVVYRKILKTAGNNPEIVKKIGNQFLGVGEYDLACSLLEEAYQVYPNEPEIRSCLLIAKLKLAGVDAESYLEKKQRVESFLVQGMSPDLLLGDLLHLESEYRFDSDVQHDLGEVYRKIGKNSESMVHFEQMISCDPLNSQYRLDFAKFLIDLKHYSEANKLILGLEIDEGADESQYVSLCWLRASLSAVQSDYQKAMFYGKKALVIDPWDVYRLAQMCLWSIKMKYPDREDLLDRLLFKLGLAETSGEDWAMFVKQSEFFKKENCHEIVYIRAKICFLYDGSSEDSLRELVQSAIQFDAQNGVSDLLRLLNTNFDGFWVYWALGKLSKEMWQLETASMWLEQILNTKSLGTELKAAVYSELSDCYVWRNCHLQKAVEFTKTLLDGATDPKPEAQVTLAHAYLKLGSAREAQEVLDLVDIRSASFEARYLHGLILYRNGMTRKAKELWKPLLSNHSRDVKSHHIKQELLKFYFSSELYLKVN